MKQNVKYRILRKTRGSTYVFLCKHGNKITEIKFIMINNLKSFILHKNHLNYIEQVY